MTAAKFGKTDGQIAIRLDALVENLAVGRTVHGLDRVITLFAVRGKHRVSVVIPVPCALPERLIHHQRRADFAIVFFVLIAAHVLLENLIHGPTCGVPEHHARGFFLQMEQVHPLGQLTVIALFGLFQKGLVGL